MSKTSQRKVSAFNQGRESFKSSGWINESVDVMRAVAKISQPMPKKNKLSTVWYAGFMSAQNGQLSNKIKKDILRRKMALAGR